MIDLKPFVPLLGFAILVGCRPPVTSGITAYTQSEAILRKRYLLQGPDPRNLGGDPRWPVFAKILEKALDAKGFVKDGVTPELIIRVTYRIGDTQTYTSTTTTPAPTDADGVAVGFPTESTTTSETTMRVIQLEALDPGSLKAGRPVVLWRTHATSRGADDDIAKVFPAMVAAMEEYFAGSASTMVEVEKKVSDPEVRRLSAP